MTWSFPFAWRQQTRLTSWFVSKELNWMHIRYLPSSSPFLLLGSTCSMSDIWSQSQLINVEVEIEVTSKNAPWGTPKTRRRSYKPFELLSANWEYSENTVRPLMGLLYPLDLGLNNLKGWYYTQSCIWLYFPSSDCFSTKQKNGKDNIFCDKRRKCFSVEDTCYFLA